MHDVILSVNDAHTRLRNGVQVPVEDAAPDTLNMIDMGGDAPRIVASVPVPASVVGPPTSVWAAPDGTWAIVTAATRIEAGAIVPHDGVSVVDLSASPPRMVQTLRAGAGAATVRVLPDGARALIANRNEGTVSLFTVADRRLTPAGRVDFGSPRGGASGLVILADGRTALVSRDFDHCVSVLRLDGADVTVDPRPISTGLRPYTMDLSGTLVGVSNVGLGDGDVDTVSLIDTSLSPMRTVFATWVPSGPEGLRFSPDGRHLAVACQNGTTKPPGSPLYNPRGVLVLFAVDGRALRRVAEAPIGGWSQGIAFSRDGRTILVQDMIERRLSVFRFEANGLTALAPLHVDGGPAAFS